MDDALTIDEPSVADYLSSISHEHISEDASALLAMMRRVSGHDPKLWSVGTIGFDAYHYRYDSGREGDSFVIGFYPRKEKITVYLMDGTARYAKQLAELGKHSITGYCIYVKRLSDIDLSVLEQIIRRSYEHINRIKTEAGYIDRILWRTDS